tara:strand:- start:182 stop:412 length:231 start_codon:yes stop_codon:yes gene_type:complete
MNIEVNLNKNLDNITLQKMTLIYNALEKGWTINKKDKCYIFKKNHNNKKEIYLDDDFLRRFMVENFDINSLSCDDK